MENPEQEWEYNTIVAYLRPQADTQGWREKMQVNGYQPFHYKGKNGENVIITLEHLELAKELINEPRFQEAITSQGLDLNDICLLISLLKE